MYLRPNALGQPRIIVMDPDASILSRLCGLLQSKGYLPVGVEAALLACEMVHRRRVDLVLTTIALPEAERRAWTAALHQLGAHVPVIAMCEASSAHALDLFDTANEFGATAVLRRPFTASTLLQMLDEMLPAPMQRDAAAAQRHPADPDWLGLISGSTTIH